MPELPEVETVTRGLAPVMEGRRILDVAARRADLRFAFPADFTSRLKGRRVERLTRRAKYILIHLEGGLVLIVHLGMTGRFTVLDPTGAADGLGDFYYQAAAGAGADGPHDHVVFTLEGSIRLVYSDPRRFGFMELAAAADLETHKYFKGMGPEPLGNGLSAEILAEKLKGRKTPLKSALLDQANIAGLGNIYVCEALHAAGLSPKRQAGSLILKSGPKPVVDSLIRAIRVILEDAIRAGGSTLRDYAGADGAKGSYQQVFAVYGRENEPCLKPACAGTVRRIVQAGRSTFYCASCQR